MRLDTLLHRILASALVGLKLQRSINEGLRPPVEHFAFEARLRCLASPTQIETNVDGAHKTTKIRPSSDGARCIKLYPLLVLAPSTQDVSYFRSVGLHGCQPCVDVPLYAKAQQSRSCSAIFLLCVCVCFCFWLAVCLPLVYVDVCICLRCMSRDVNFAKKFMDVRACCPEF